MSEIAPTSDALFESGPFPNFQKALGLFRPVGFNVARRAEVCVAIGWLPLVLLVLVQFGNNDAILYSFLTDFGVHGRSLLAAPLFVLAEKVCLKSLDKIAHHFVEAGLIDGNDRLRFNAAVVSTRKLMNSLVAEIICIGGVYVLVIALVRYVSPAIFPEWCFNAGRISWAGWWSWLVSMPLLLVLFFGWLWRILLWGRFLTIVSRLKLRLIAAHPDHAAGLRFLNSALFAFMPFAFTLGIITAGPIANRVLHQSASIDNVKMTILGLVIVVLVLVAGPLLVFIKNLHHEKVTGTLEYGLLAQNVGRDFESKWLEHYEKYGDGALEATDFSATTDLYGIAANVNELNLVPFTLRSLASLVIVTLLPFVPVLLMMIPLKVILDEAASLLF
jgi:hypothetical protein